VATTPIAGTTTATTQAANNRKSLAEQFDGFLVLLTTQLKNQDPLSPMDANQFTEQLVQFTGVEQSVNMNKKLDDVLKMMQADPIGSGSQYLGKEIEAAGNRAIIGETGATNIGVNLPEGVAAALVTILDANGQPLRILKAAPAAGSQSVTWDGRDAQGKRVGAGTYDVRVNAVDDTGAAMNASTGVRGVVTGVESRYGSIVLTVGKTNVPLADVHAVRVPTATNAG
jgi:flagellar basal-body rod modification protein FlgD